MRDDAGMRRRSPTKDRDDRFRFAPKRHETPLNGTEMAHVTWAKKTQGGFRGHRRSATGEKKGDDLGAAPKSRGFWLLFQAALPFVQSFLVVVP